MGNNLVDFERFYNNFLFKWEGTGFSIVPGDYGGPTNSGITQKGFDDYCSKNGLATHSVETLVGLEIHDVYFDIWKSASCPLMDYPIDVCHFDLSVNAGITRASKILQKVLGNLVVDGMIGDKTRARLYQVDPVIIANSQINAREQWYRDIVEADKTQDKFLNGWIARCNDLRKYIGPKEVA